jgi:hypothetical protein
MSWLSGVGSPCHGPARPQAASRECAAPLKTLHPRLLARWFASSAHLGHKSAALTLNVYSHLWPHDDDRARAAVEAFFGGGVSPVCHDEVAG